MAPSLGHAAGVTFNQEVLPILQKRCQGCHRPGEVAPMSLLTYSDARPWAKAIRQAVLTRKMPPWFADPHYGKFSNDPSLSQSEIDTLTAWVDGGAKEGNPAAAPAPVQFVEGWNIGKPDMVWEMPNAFDVPASGVVDYNYVIIPTGLTEDKWVQAVETRPGNRAVLHHVIVFTRDPGSQWFRDRQPGVPFVPKGRGAGAQASGGMGGYAPGMVPTILKPGRAIFLKAGSDLVLQLHYTPNGKPATDKTRIGVIFANEPPKQRVMTLAAGNLFFKIPPQDPNYRVDGSITLPNDVELVDMMPHMHVRGKAFEYRIVYPDGKKETLLSVPHYDFNWQLSYFPERPLMLAKGTKIETTGWFDNSPNNPANPDPAKEVRYGEQTWEEMMFGFFTVAVDLKPPSPPNTAAGLTEPRP
jgi:hypothetical protein